MLISMNELQKPMEVKALAFDLDGTLLAPGSVLTPRTARAVRSCVKKGLQVILATGRAVAAAEKYRAALDVSGSMVFFNGAVVTDMPANTILHTTLLDKRVAQFCLELSRKEGIYYQVYTPGTPQKPGQPLFTEKVHAQRDMYFEHTGILAELCGLDELFARADVPGFIKIMFLAEPDTLDRIRPVIEEKFGRDVYVVRTYGTFLEIFNSRISKGIGLDIALEHRGLSPKETIVFGDEENDLPMFVNAGLSVAPANAKDYVKTMADIIAGSNAEDGIAAFLEETLL